MRPQPNREANFCYGFPENAVEVVVVVDGDLDPKVSQFLCAANQPRITIVKDTRAREYALVDYAKRNQSSVDDTLIVFRLDKHQLVEVFTTRLSCTLGKGAKYVRDKYTYSTTASAASGLALSLHGPASTAITSTLSSYGDLPCEDNQTYWIDPGQAFTKLASPADLQLSATVASAPTLGLSYADESGLCTQMQDQMVLLVSDEANAHEVRFFCSSYGNANASAFSDAHGHKYALLEYGEGHGTGLARTPYLVALRLMPFGPVEIARTTLAWATGSSVQFTYKPEAAVASGGGLVITLRGDADNGELNRCCVPSEMNRTIWIDPVP